MTIDELLEKHKSAFINICMSMSDDFIKANADFRYKAGLKETIKRIVTGKGCKWCRALAGSYDYPYDVPEDVYRRHDNCRCIVSHESSKGIQNVHSKQWKTNESRRQTLYTYDDPIREILGSAQESNPEETKHIIGELKELGVKVRYREGVMAYQPSPTPGLPGQIVIDPKASFSALLHEQRHAKDDAKTKWRGFHNFIDPQIAAEFEERAYDLEIEYAEKLGYTQIVTRLKKLKENRLKDLLHE